MKVKAGVKSPDDDSLSIAGWQGRLSDIDKDEDTIGIQWDGITLDEMPPGFIKHSEIEGLDWAEMYVGVDEIELAPPRDSETEAKRAREALHSRYRWFDGSDEANESYGVLVNVTRGDERMVFPLCDVTVLNKKSPCYLPVEDYRVWFANR